MEIDCYNNQCVHDLLKIIYNRYQDLILRNARIWVFFLTKNVKIGVKKWGI
jgi:hypothetical protein